MRASCKAIPGSIRQTVSALDIFHAEDTPPLSEVRPGQVLTGEGELFPLREEIKKRGPPDGIKKALTAARVSAVYQCLIVQ